MAAVGVRLVSVQVIVVVVLGHHVQRRRLVAVVLPKVLAHLQRMSIDGYWQSSCTGASAAGGAACTDPPADARHPKMNQASLPAPSSSPGHLHILILLSLKVGKPEQQLAKQQVASWTKEPAQDSTPDGLALGA